MQMITKDSAIFLLIGALLYLLAGISLAKEEDSPIFLKPEAGHLIYIVNNSKTIPVLAVGYKLCSYDHANEKIKAWVCSSKEPNNIAVVQKDKVFIVSVPNNFNKVEYAMQIFSVKDALNQKSDELMTPFVICRAEGEKNTLILTNDVGDNSRNVKCNILQAW